MLLLLSAISDKKTRGKILKWMRNFWFCRLKNREFLPFSQLLIKYHYHSVLKDIFVFLFLLLSTFIKEEDEDDDLPLDREDRREGAHPL